MQYVVVLVLIVALVLGGMWMLSEDTRHDNRMDELRAEKALAAEQTKQTQAMMGTAVTAVLGFMGMVVVIGGLVVFGSLAHGYITRPAPSITYNQITTNNLLIPPPEMGRMDMWRQVALLSNPDSITYLPEKSYVSVANKQNPS